MVLHFFSYFHLYRNCTFIILVNLFGSFLFYFFLLDNDYYYGGSMRDLNNGYGRPRKASSVSHLGEYIAWVT